MALKKESVSVTLTFWIHRVDRLEIPSDWDWFLSNELLLFRQVVGCVRWRTWEERRLKNSNRKHSFVEMAVQRRWQILSSSCLINRVISAQLCYRRGLGAARRDPVSQRKLGDHVPMYHKAASV